MKTEEEIKKEIVKHDKLCKSMDEKKQYSWASAHKLIANTYRTVLNDELVGFTSGEEYLAEQAKLYVEANERLTK